MYVKTCSDAPEAGYGTLPAQAPLANPYVPFQPAGAPKYEAGKGLVRGTLFPGLDLPFMDMVNQGQLPDTPGHQLQALAFAIQELALYLDTHPDDADAFELYKVYGEMFSKAKKSYEATCGPLTHHSLCQGEHYAWLDAPWPWEYPGNKR